MDFQNKKLLILAGAGVHTKVVRAAKEMGIYTIVTDYLEDSPAKKAADEAWMYDIFDVEGIVKKCKEIGIDGVLNFCIDPAQWPYLEICERLGLPCYASRDQLEVLTKKISFKEYCTAHGVDVIPEYTLDDIIEDKAEYPLFIKPSVNRGSRGQYVCYSKEEALAWLQVLLLFPALAVFHKEDWMQEYLLKNQDQIPKEFLMLSCPSLFWVPLLAGFVIGLVVIFMAQKKYNGSVLG